MDGNQREIAASERTSGHITDTIDCSRLKGRQFQICMGTSGLPEAKRVAYLKLWAAQGLLEPLPYGLGDFVGDCIKVVTFGLLEPKKGCGCEGRKNALNLFGQKAMEFMGLGK